MAYIELQDLIDEVGEDKLIELTDDTGSGEIGEKVALNAIEYSQGVFESYARARYSLPVPATAMVKSCCLNLAVYQLFRKRAMFADDGVFKVKKTAYDETISLLKDINAGRAALDVPAVEETIETPATGDRILTNAGRSKFNDQKLSGF